MAPPQPVENRWGIVDIHCLGSWAALYTVNTRLSILEIQGLEKLCRVATADYAEKTADYAEKTVERGAGCVKRKIKSEIAALRSQ